MGLIFWRVLASLAAVAYGIQFWNVICGYPTDSFLTGAVFAITAVEMAVIAVFNWR